MSVSVAVENGVAHVRLTRGRGNPIDLATAEGLLDSARRCEHARAVLLTAAGPAFCVGGDLREFAAAGDLRAHLDRVTGALHEALRILAALDAPVVAAVRGAVAGAGLGLLGVADLVVAADDVGFVAAYTGIGYTPDAGVSWSLPRLVGPRLALELLLTNRRLTAAEALAAGLVTSIAVDPEQAAAALAEQLTGAAFGVTKRLVRDGATTPFGQHLDTEARAIAEAAVSPSGRDGVAAFLARKPL
ncbi:enoyl-CoA hydratase/isomerase family protein [Amycolatopsis balhimycina DSM 5908]|uniref:Enoyl-CoA hydratase/isomerase family protein n=1 Tax=Amycolatopsis balhimycina DSM 5908 TaxID=1081091 RepID=A0A428W3X4_AMYBA|nr:enoyl-CoA hydratase/isomerase family protein [Amycolatopsis balhimycina]RSM37782.1 enoyl-CoA hydratase/isomerase family protein [Amycolatopsis balhimycina DSM 5908]